MRLSELLWTCILVVSLVFTSELIHTVYAQINISNKSSNMDGNSDISATISFSVSNKTLQLRIESIYPTVLGFLNSGPSVLKMSPTTEPIVKTIVTNSINNNTQTVEGVDATNAILGVEINKALRTVNSSSFTTNQIDIVTIDTTSLCKLSDPKSITCQNNVTIK